MDVELLIALGRFFAGKLRAAAWYELFEATKTWRRVGAPTPVTSGDDREIERLRDATAATVRGLTGYRPMNQATGRGRRDDGAGRIRRIVIETPFPLAYAFCSETAPDTPCGTPAGGGYLVHVARCWFAGIVPGAGPA